MWGQTLQGQEPGAYRYNTVKKEKTMRICKHRFFFLHEKLSEQAELWNLNASPTVIAQTKYYLEWLDRKYGSFYWARLSSSKAILTRIPAPFQQPSGESRQGKAKKKNKKKQRIAVLITWNPFTHKGIFRQTGSFLPTPHPNPQGKKTMTPLQSPRLWPLNV